MTRPAGRPQYSHGCPAPQMGLALAGEVAVDVAAAGRGSDHGERETLPPAQDHAARAGSRAGRQPPAPVHRPGSRLDPRRNASRIPDRRAAGGHRRRALDVPRAGTAEARAQAADRYSARAVLLEPVTPPVTIAAASGDDQAWVLAQWQGTGTAPRTGKVPATVGSPAGSAVTVWLDASGKLTGPPLQPGQVTDRTIAVAVLVPGVLALSLLTAQSLAQRLADRRRLAAWDAAWSTVGPQWTRRKP